MSPLEPAPPPSEDFAQFDALFRHAPFGAALFDRALRYVRVNEALATLNGRPAAAHLGKTPREVVPAYGDVIEAELRRVFETGAPGEVFEAEVTLPGRPDEQRVVRVRFFPVEEGGAVTHVGGSLLDVTEQRRAQDVLHASERQLRQVVEAAPSGIVMVDAAGRIVLVNQQVERLFGYGREELLGQSVDVLVPEALRRGHGRNREVFGRAPAARPMGAGRDLHGRRRDGSTFPLEIGLTPVETPEGPAVLATVVDITERKRVEEALRESEAETHRLALVAARTTNGVVITDTQGRVEWVNDAFIRLSGYTLDELHGRRPGDLLQGPNTDAATTARVRESVLAREPFAAELLNYRKDGVPFWVRVEATPLFEDGAFAGYITIQTDVTERKEAEAALRASEERYRTFVTLSQEGVFRFEIDVPIDTTAPAEAQVEQMLRGAVLAECNDAYARMYGYEHADELVGAPLGRFLPPDEPRTRAYLYAFVEEGYRLTQAESFEHDRDGMLRVFSNDLVGVVEEGRLVRAWGTQRDVTGRVVAEAARRESEAALQLALDVAQMGTWAVDLPGREVRRTASTDRLFGFPADNALRTAADFLALVHPEDRARFEAMLRGTLRNRGGGVAAEFRILRADTGEERWLSARGALERDASGRPARLVGAFVDVTDRVRAEEALRASEERFRTISELTSDFAYSARLREDGSFEREWVIGAYERITGYDPEETGPHDGWREVVHPDDHALGEAHLARFLAGETSVSEHRILRKDGAVRWIRDITRPVFDAAGRVVGAVGAAQDVTAQREAEAAAAAAARRNEQILESIDDAFYALDREWRFTYFNNRAEELFQRPRHELLGRNLWEVFPHNVGSVYWEQYHRALETGEPAAFDTYSEALGVHFAMRVFPFEHGLSVYFRDVTAEKRAAEALRASEERLRLALEGGAMGTWEWDLATDALLADAREAALLGCPLDALPTREALLALVLPEDRDGVRAATRAAIEGGHDYAHEFRIVRPDGEVRWLSGRGRVLRDADGRAVRMFGLNFDITERRRAEEELRRQTREMEQFTYTVSHDLKSPIVTVTGFLGILEAHVEAGRAEEAKAAAARIRRAAERMSRLTDDLLELSRIGRLSGERRVVDVSALVEELADAQAPRLAGCTITVQTDMPPLRADARRLAEAFDNLLTNAVKYGCGGGATRIAVRAEEADGEVRYVVEDNGPGIAAEHHERIFEVFQRGASDPDGTGMGLAIVRKIMEVHEGRVWVESAPGAGARFVLAFPRQAAVAGPAA